MVLEQRDGANTSRYAARITCSKMQYCGAARGTDDAEETRFASILKKS
jgi:hypothetical protein